MKDTIAPVTPKVGDINTLDITQLRGLISRAKQRIEALAPFERTKNLKRGSIICIEKNRQAKAYGWDRWFHYKFIGTDPKRETHMVISGPIDEGSTEPRVVTISKTFLRRVVKKA